MLNELENKPGIIALSYLILQSLIHANLDEISMIELNSNKKINLVQCYIIQIIAVNVQYGEKTTFEYAVWLASCIL